MGFDDSIVLTTSTRVASLALNGSTTLAVAVPQFATPAAIARAGLIVYGADSASSSRVFAVAAATGAPLWDAAVPYLSSGGVVVDGNGSVYAAASGNASCATCGTLTALRSNGSTAWSAAVLPPGAAFVRASVGADGAVLATVNVGGGGNGSVVAFAAVRPSPSATPSPVPTPNVTVTATPTPTANVTATPTATMSANATASASPSPSGSMQPSWTPAAAPASPPSLAVIAAASAGGAVALVGAVIAALCCCRCCEGTLASVLACCPCCAAARKRCCVREPDVRAATTTPFWPSVNEPAGGGSVGGSGGYLPLLAGGPGSAAHRQ